MSEQSPTMNVGTYVYSLIRAVPNPRRDEAVNIGVIVLASDGHYSEARFGRLGKVRRLDRNADLDLIQVFLNGITGSLPLHRHQTHSLGTKETVLTLDTLNMWSREFGGAVRVTEPRSALSADPDALVERLFKDYVGPIRSQQKIAIAEDHSRPVVRGDLLKELDRAVPHWKNHAVKSVAGVSLPGRRAHHFVDRVLEAQGGLTVALVQAISFESPDLAEIYAHRATICLAAEDIHEAQGTSELRAFAIHTSAPKDRIEALQESAELFNAKGVTPVLYGDLRPVQGVVERVLSMASGPLGAS